MLAETVVEAGRRFGDRPVLVAEDGWSLTYQDLDRLSDETAHGLRRMGVGEGDVVATVLPASPEHFVAYAAVAKLGAITAAVNGRLAPPERAAVLALAEPKVVLGTAELLVDVQLPSAAMVEEILPAETPGDMFRWLRDRGESSAGRGAGALPADPDRPVAIVFTSGTTGVPKGAVFCGRQLSFVTRCDVGGEWGGGGRSLTGSALAHLGPMTKFPGNLRRGSTQYLSSTWQAANTLRRVSELKIAAVGGVPTQLALMLRVPEFDSYDLSSVQAIVIGGGPATPSLIREARKRFNAPLAVRYSCTEAAIGTGTSFTDPEEDAEISVGRAQNGVTLAILDEAGDRLPEGEVGEVCLSSPAVMSGYWRDSQGTKEALTSQGGVRTGDLGWIDQAGRLRLAGRAKERYVRGGFNVYPMEVESVLADHPDVSAVAVVGKADPVMGEVGVAVIVPAPGKPVPTLESMRSFAEHQLARYKLPDEIAVVPALPLTAMEKLDRRALSELVASGRLAPRPLP